jgi:hypothetical protein
MGDLGGVFGVPQLVLVAIVVAGYLYWSDKKRKR